MLLWIYCFRLFFIRTFVCLSISWSTAWNLGSFKVYSLFSYQCTSSILRIDFRSCFATSERIFQSHSSLSSLGDSLFTISYRQPFVNNFFIFLCFLFHGIFLLCFLLSFHHSLHFFFLFSVFKGVFISPVKCHLYSCCENIKKAKAYDKKSKILVSAIRIVKKA